MQTRTCRAVAAINFMLRLFFSKPPHRREWKREQNQINISDVVPGAQQQDLLDGQHAHVYKEHLGEQRVGLGNRRRRPFGKHVAHCTCIRN